MSKASQRERAPAPGTPCGDPDPSIDVTGRTFVKTAPGGDELLVEAAGLRWLAEAENVGGARIVSVLEYSSTRLVESRLVSVRPTRAAAEEFGRALARTHAAGADGHCCGPPGVDGDAWIGRARMPLAPRPVDGAGPDWAGQYARLRLLPYRPALVREAGNEAADVLDRVVDRLLDGDDFVTSRVAPARLHGDLWSGNVVWTGDGVVLVDPAAHGGHPETDLAMLALFGCPHLDAIIGSYQEVSPLEEGWRERVGLHQLWPLLVHTRLFGGGYAWQTVETARRYA